MAKHKRERQGFRLFRPTYKDHAGNRHETAHWYVEFRDHLATVRRLPAFASKNASAELGRNLVALVSYHKATGGQVDPALTDWLGGLPQRTRDKLTEYGLLPAERSGAAKLLAEHVRDWQAALTAKGNTPDYVTLKASRVLRVFDGAKARRYGDIRGSCVASYLNDLRADRKDADGTVTRGISAQTFNFYLGATKQFCRWMLKERRAAENPVAHLDALNVRTDRRHDRRALSVDELKALLDTTREGPDREGMTGKERYWLYRVAVETGLRANELRTLTRGAFALGGDRPTVTVAAAYSKHRREDTLPLRRATAAALADFLNGRAGSAQVFALTPSRHHAAKMFKADLAAAGIEYRDDADRVADFHSLRHTFITNLANGGVHPRKAQALARHCTITLTMDRYSHVVHDDLMGALDALPDLSEPTPERARATGTYDATASPGPRADADSVLALRLAQNGRRGSIPVDSCGRKSGSRDDSQVATDSRFPAKNTGKTAHGRGGRVAQGAGLENR